MFFSILLLLAHTSAGYILPTPPGRYNVTLTTGPLIDHSRKVSNGTAKSVPRELMLSVFQPTTCTSTVPVPYMPNKTAEFQGPFLEKLLGIPFDLSSLFLEARLPVCRLQPRDCAIKDDSPILLFSPGYGVPRLYYSELASAIASEGFTVITIDHPDDANIITYPDGSVIYGRDALKSDDATIKKHQPPRVLDASFVLDQLRNATAVAKLLPHRGHRPFSTDHVAIMGHSLGGSAAITAAGADARFRGAINWDGSIWGPLPSAGLSKPVLLMSRAANETSPSWDAAWPHFKAAKLWLQVANTTHYSFSDAPTLLQASGQDTAAFSSLVGTIAPPQMIRTLAAYTSAWMSGAFAGKEGGALLQGQESKKYPEVSTIRKSNF